MLVVDHIREIHVTNYKLVVYESAFILDNLTSRQGKRTNLFPQAWQVWQALACKK